MKATQACAKLGNRSFQQIKANLPKSISWTPAKTPHGLPLPDSQELQRDKPDGAAQVTKAKRHYSLVRAAVIQNLARQASSTWSRRPPFQVKSRQHPKVRFERMRSRSGQQQLRVDFEAHLDEFHENVQEILGQLRVPQADTPPIRGRGCHRKADKSRGQLGDSAIIES